MAELTPEIKAWLKADGWVRIGKPTTNADRIRAMSDEDLAEWVSYVSNGCDYIRCPAGHKEFIDSFNDYSVSCAKGCKLVWLEWLREPVGGAE